MNIAKYAQQARRTAVYPRTQFITYPALGLADEVSELIEKILDDAGEAAIKKEMGDVIWYVVNTALDCNIKVHLLIDGCETFEAVQDMGMLPDPTQFMRIVVDAGKVCGLAKKLHRDDGGKLSPERREKIRLSLGMLICRLASMCKAQGWSLAEIARENNVKLAGRQQRGTLTGDGDNR